MNRECILYDLPLTPYGEVWRLQKDLVALMRRDAAEPERLILVEHPRVVTVGRRAERSELKIREAEYRRRGYELFHIERGGKTTYHGPGQLVGYPLMRLAERGRDVHRYLRALEQLVIRVARAFGVAGSRRAGLTGVWVGDEKLASIGIAVRRWITSHGFALNVSTNLDDFSVIDPCGLGGVRMTSLEKLTGAAPDMAEVRRVTRMFFADLFDVSLAPARKALEGKK